MANQDFLEEQFEETHIIIEELLADGSDPDALYTIEHHLAADDFATLEKAATEAFKLGFEVTDAEEVDMDDGSTLICCDVISETTLDPEVINQQVEQLFALAERCGADYDGWGTYFEDPDGDEDGEEYDDEDEDDYDSDDDDVEEDDYRH